MLPRPFPLWLGLVSALTAVGLIAAYLLESPYSWILVGLTLVSIAGGTHFLLRGNPFHRFYSRKPATIIAWIPPLLFAFAGIAFIKQLLGGPYAWIGIIGTIFGVVLLVVCQYFLALDRHPIAPLAHLVTSLLLYLATFILIVALQTGNDLNSLSPLIGGFTGLTAYQLLRQHQHQANRDLAFAVVIGILIAELSWGLYFLFLGKIYSGLALTIIFYVLVGISHNHLEERLTRWVGLEFVGVGMVSLFLLYSFRMFGG